MGSNRCLRFVLAAGAAALLCPLSPAVAFVPDPALPIAPAPRSVPPPAMPATPTSQKPGAPAGNGLRFIARPTDDRALTATEKETARQRWSRALAAVSSAERAPFFFDVSLTDDPPFLTEDGPGGDRAMKLLSWNTRRRWRQVDGVQLFTRAPDSDDPLNGLNFRQVLLPWLQNLPPEDRDALGHGRLDLRHVDPAMRDALVAWSMSLAPKMAGVLLSRGDRANLRLSIHPWITWVDPKTGQERESFIRVRFPPMDLPSDDPAPTGGEPSAQPPPYIPLGRAEAGPLDFGAGRVMELPEVLAEAGRAFGIRYDSDARLMHASYFVSGKFSRRSFLDALRAATSVEPSGESRVVHGDLGGARVASLIQDSFPELLQEPFMVQPDLSQPPALLAISPSAFAQGQALTFGILAGNNEAWVRKWESSRGLAPDSVVTLSLTLALEIDSGAVHAGLIFK